jgi:hypothetical protein
MPSLFAAHAALLLILGDPPGVINNKFNITPTYLISIGRTPYLQNFTACWMISHSKSLERGERGLDRSKFTVKFRDEGVS